jgi:DICT domain-containing protein
MATTTDPELSTAQLAARTGQPAGTLRMWESRHGFPAPARLPGGHRRYSERDVDAVLEVLRLREQGLSLPAAIERARRQSLPLDGSVFSALRRRRPEIAPSVMAKRALLPITHAIEDEYLARGASGFVFGSFQREHYYRISERRWRELARSTPIAVAVADFSLIREPGDAPSEVPVEIHQPLAREWTVIVDAPGAHACLAAWEQPSQTELPDRDRRFEVMWSFEPDVVRAASEVAYELLWSLAPAVARRLPELEPPTASGIDELRFASALAQRIVGYLGTTLARPRPSRR